MPKYIKPISISNFPANIITNCFGFAIGDTESLETKDSQTKFNMDGSLPIDKAFYQKLEELGYDELPRQISTVEEANPGEYVLEVFDFTKYTYRTPFMGELDDPIVYYDFHVIRREPDGTWVHKPGWKDQPCKIQTAADWNDIYNEFGCKYVLFAVTAK